jgi:hypothetical protein
MVALTREVIGFFVCWIRLSSSQPWSSEHYSIRNHPVLPQAVILVGNPYDCSRLIVCREAAHLGRRLEEELQSSLTSIKEADVHLELNSHADSTKDVSF